MTLEIHESAVTKATGLAELRSLLKRLEIKLAYDDFGVGQSRLNDLAEVAPDYVKFDMSLDSRHRQRHGAAAAVGLRAGADGPQPGHRDPCRRASRPKAKTPTCRQMGFELGQGYLYGRPAPPRDF